MDGVATRGLLDSLWLVLPNHDVNAITGDEEGVNAILKLDFSDKLGELIAVGGAESWISME